MGSSGSCDPKGPLQIWHGAPRGLNPALSPVQGEAN